jgi:iron complex outermembrane recepter protein
VAARFHGFEFEGGWRALEGATTLDLDGKLDSTRATNSDTGQPLPRIAPLRATLGATLAQGSWSARAEVERAQRQSHVPSDDTATAGYTLVNLSASYKLKLGPTDGLLFAKLTNLGNTLAYSATTIATVRPLSPLPGRALTAGLRVSF